MPYSNDSHVLLCILRVHLLRLAHIFSLTLTRDIHVSCINCKYYVTEFDSQSLYLAFINRM